MGTPSAMRTCRWKWDVGVQPYKEYELCRGRNAADRGPRSRKPKRRPGVEVPMKIFYEDSECRCTTPAISCSFTAMTAMPAGWAGQNHFRHGKTGESSRYYILLGPGRGLQIQNGAYAGRLIVPVHYQGAPDAEVIYSDDGGRTWKHGESVSSIYGLSKRLRWKCRMEASSCFAQHVCFGGTVVEATSTDGGQTWRDVKSTFETTAGINCQMSAVRLGSPVRSRADGRNIRRSCCPAQTGRTAQTAGFSWGCSRRTAQTPAAPANRSTGNTSMTRNAGRNAVCLAAACPS